MFSWAYFAKRLVAIAIDNQSKLTVKWTARPNYVPSGVFQWNSIPDVAAQRGS